MPLQINLFAYKYNMLNVLFMNHAVSEKVGGAEKVLFDVLRSIDQDVVRPVLLCPPIPQDSMLSDLKKSIPVYEKKFGCLVFKNPFWGLLTIFFNAIRLCFYIWFIIKKEKINIIYANTLIAAFFALLPAALFGKRIVYHEHGLPALRKGSLWQKCFPLVTRKATRIIAISHAVKIALVQEGVDEQKISVIHNGIDLYREMPETPYDICRELNIPAGHRIVGKVAHFLPWKGQLTLLRAIPRVLQEMPDVTFIFLGRVQTGNDAYLNQLQSFILDTGIEKNVVFAGFRNDAFSIMGSFDMLVHASDEEPFGLIFLEAMLLGKPVIATDAGAAPEMVVHGTTGFLFPYADHAALAERIIELLLDPALCAQMGARGSGNARTHFSLQRQVSAVQTLLSKIGSA